MIPQRFATEYPQRCLQLLDAFEPIAKELDLYGSFSVMVAASILIVPWERATRREENPHPLMQEHNGNLQAALTALKRHKWLEADFWLGNRPGDWRFSRIMDDPNAVHAWQDNKGRPSFSPDANTIERRKADEVFRVLRNALAHGNIIYLDQHGHETAGARVEHIAFLSRYEESKEQRATAQTYRLVTVRETDFLPFVRAWAVWVAQHHDRDDDLRVS